MRKYFKIISISISILLFSFFLLEKAVAQTIPDLYSERDIFVTTSPDVPGTFDDVHISIDSYSINLNNHLITWYVDNKKQVSEYGKKDFTIKTGGMGTKTIISIVVTIEGFQTIRKSISISPSELDLLWEAVDSYTPPFYKGKALPLIEGRIKIVAIPETRFVSPTQAKQMVYYWERDNDPVPNKSGYGRQTFTFQNSVFMPKETIEVRMNNRSENSFGKKRITLNIEEFNPKIVFYTYDENGRLLLNQSFNAGKSIKQDQFIVSMHPYFISTKKPFSDLLLQWKMNGNVIKPPNPLKQTEILFNTNGQVGLTEIKIEFEHFSKLFQGAKASLNLNLR